MTSFMDALAGSNKEMLAELESLLGYRFTDLRLLQKAMIHSSYAFEQAQAGQDNQVFEFIGDAVLDLVIGHSLSKRYPEMKEGELTRFRASLVNESHLADMARNLDLGKYLCLGKGEDSSNGRNKSSILSCALEAVVGAIFEDSDYPTAAGLVELLFKEAVKEKRKICCWPMPRAGSRSCCRKNTWKRRLTASTARKGRPTKKGSASRSYSERTSSEPGPPVPRKKRSNGPRPPLW